MSLSNFKAMVEAEAKAKANAQAEANTSTPKAPESPEPEEARRKQQIMTNMRHKTFLTTDEKATELATASALPLPDDESAPGAAESTNNTEHDNNAEQASASSPRPKVLQPGLWSNPEKPAGPHKGL